LVDQAAWAHAIGELGGSRAGSTLRRRGLAYEHG
jgi:hypothetical protein